MTEPDQKRNKREEIPIDFWHNKDAQLAIPCLLSPGLYPPSAFSFSRCQDHPLPLVVAYNYLKREGRIREKLSLEEWEKNINPHNVFDI